MTYQANTYDDDDMRDIIDQIEAHEASKKAIIAKAMGECSGLSAKIKELKKTAKDDLSIPLKVLNPILKRRKLERQIDDINEGVDEDFAEVFEDAVGQFCMFAPIEDTEQGAQEDYEADTDDEVTADPTEAELAEGEAVLGQVKH